MIRRLVAIGAAAALALMAPAVANADTTDAYPPSEPGLTVSGGSGGEVTAGEAITLHGTGYAANEDVAISYDVAGAGLRSLGAAFVEAPTLIKTVKADASGAFTTTVMIDTPGTYTITAVGQTSGHSESVTVTVASAATTSSAAAAPGGGSNMPNTGVNHSMLVFGSIGGVLALVLGGALVWLGVSRRRGGHAVA